MNENGLNGHNTRCIRPTIISKTTKIAKIVQDTDKLENQN